MDYGKENMQYVVLFAVIASKNLIFGILFLLKLNTLDSVLTVLFFHSVDDLSSIPFTLSIIQLQLFLSKILMNNIYFKFNNFNDKSSQSRYVEKIYENHWRFAGIENITLMLILLTVTTLYLIYCWKIK